MLVDIRSRTGRISSGLRSYVHRVRDLNFGRFRHRVREVVVKVADDHGEHTRECEVEVRLGDRTQVVARARAGDLYAAISRAFERAARAVASRPPAKPLARALPPLLPARSG